MLGLTMTKTLAVVLAAGALACSRPGAPAGSQPMSTASDTLTSSQGPLEFTPLHHATFLMRFAGKAIYLDPVKEGRYDGLPKATHIFVTDVHPDHLDPAALDALRTPSTVLVGPKVVADKVPGFTTMANGESRNFDGFSVEAVPMYNLQRGPAEGKLYHDKGRGNGYVFTVGDRRVYVSGDTECIPEMKALRNIDVAFVCMNLPYTMPPSEAAQCVKAMRPGIVYPYHFRGSDPKELQDAVAGTGIDVRLRTWY
jgi:L-ascorbate metabolism protein UlaG (beta-lactamase superfamily)